MENQSLFSLIEHRSFLTMHHHEINCIHAITEDDFDVPHVMVEGQASCCERNAARKALLFPRRIR
ncbi:MAG TPA: hypothetical protein PK823_07135 [Novosphingobium sp.]|nr:hypothetical protein [Novosphingobium sp.]